jgi:hypothetical protein
MKKSVFSLSAVLVLAIAAGVSSQESGGAAVAAEVAAPARLADLEARLAELEARAAAASSVPASPEDGFSPFTFGAWGQALWAPFVYKGDADGEVDGIAGDGPGLGVAGGPGWDSIGAAVGFELKGQNREGSGGFQLKLRAKSDGGAIYANDNTAYLWGRPFDMLKMQFGMYQYDDFRGRIGGISEFAGGYGGAEDSIFQRAESNGFGVLFILTPPSAAPAFLKPLKLFGSLGVTGELDSESGEFAALTTNGIAYIFASSQFGGGYDLDGVAFLRAQYIGRNYKWGHGDDWYNGGSFWFPSRVREWSTVETALNLSLVKNLNLDIGVSLPGIVTVAKDDFGNIKTVGPTLKELGGKTDVKVASAEGDVYQPPMTVAAGADYTVGNVRLRGRIQMSFGESVAFDAGGDNFTGGFDLEVGIEPSVLFGFGTVTGDVAVRTKGSDYLNGNDAVSHNGTLDLGLGAFFTRELGSGITLKLGVAANVPIGGEGYLWTPNGTDDQLEERSAYKNGKLLIAAPIILTVSL